MSRHRRPRSAADVARRQRSRPGSARRRRRRDHGPRNLNRPAPRRALRAWLLATGFVAVVVGLVAVAVALDAVAIRRGLVRAEARVEVAREALLDGDVPGATTELEQARAALATPTARTRRLLWDVGERLPLVGSTFRATTALVDTADAATGLGRTVLTAASDLVGPSGELTVQASADGRIDLSPVTAARAALLDLDMSRLQGAAERLRAARPVLSLAPLDDARARLLALADRTLEETSLARDLVDVLPGFLGDGEARRYLLALQNPAELRGTGGLIGFYAVVTAEDGKFTMTRPDPYEVLDEQGPAAPSRVEASDEFRDRYDQADATTFLANVNVDPDLPTVAPVALSLYRARTGQALDGMIVVDPVGLEAILGTIGPVDLAPEHEAAGLPDPVPSDRVADTLLVDAYEVLGGPTPEREEYLTEFTIAAFDRVFAGGWDAAELAPAVARTARDGHLQLFSVHEDEEAAFTKLRVGGRLAPAAPGDDLLAVTGNNAAGNKADVMAAHTLTGRIQLTQGDGGHGRVADLQVTVANPLPTTGLDVYFLQSARPGRGFIDGFGGERGLNRTWFSVWMPQDAVATGVTIDPDGAKPAPAEDADVVSSSIAGRRAVDVVLETPSQSTASFVTSLAGPIELHQRDGALVYRITLARQAKAIPDRLDLEIVPLPGWQVDTATVAGGGRGDGFGLHGDDGPAVAAAVADGVATVTGDMTRTVDIEIRMLPS